MLFPFHPYYENEYNDAGGYYSDDTLLYNLRVSTVDGFSEHLPISQVAKISHRRKNGNRPPACPPRAKEP
jgi:hypothetical protein